MKAVHKMRNEMSKEDTSGAEWLVGMHQHFGQTGEYRSVDVFRLLGDQRVSFDLASRPAAAVVCHDRGTQKVP